VNVKSLILVVLVLLICAGGIFALMAWQEDPARVADAALRGAMDTASRLMASAQNALDAPAHKFKDQYPAPDSKFADSDVAHFSFPPVYVPNPSALAAAQQGEQDLVKVINDNRSAADPNYTSMAYVLAARLAAVQGVYQSGLATSCRIQAAAARRKVRALVLLMQKQAGEAEVHQVGASLNLDVAEKALQAAKDDLDKVSQDVQTKKQQVADAQAKWEDLRKKTTQKIAQATSLRLNADRGKPREQLAQIEQVHKIEREEINPQYLQIDRLEASFKALQGEMELLKIRQVNAEQRVAVGNKILDGLKGEGEAAARGLRAIRKDAAEGLDKARAALAASQQEVEKTLSQLAKLCEEAAKAEADCNAAYQRSADLFKSASTGSDNPVAVQAGHAETLVSWADDNAESLRMHDANVTFLDQIGKAWPKLEGGAVPAAPADAAPAEPKPEPKADTAPATSPATQPATGATTQPATGATTQPATGATTQPVTAPATQPAAPVAVALGELPPVAQKINAYLPKPGELREQAIAKYKEAIDLYKKAIAGCTGYLADGKSRKEDTQWLYKGALGAAYAGLARVTGDAAQRQEALTAAATALDEALRDKQGSPYLAPVADIQKQVTGQP